MLGCRVFMGAGRVNTQKHHMHDRADVAAMPEAENTCLKSFLSCSTAHDAH